jgi:hypothetical protein
MTQITSHKISNRNLTSNLNAVLSENNKNRLSLASIGSTTADVSKKNL